MEQDTENERSRVSIVRPDMGDMKVGPDSSKNTGWKAWQVVIALIAYIWLLLFGVPAILMAADLYRTILGTSRVVFDSGLLLLLPVLPMFNLPLLLLLIRSHRGIAVVGIALDSLVFAITFLLLLLYS